MSDFHFDVKKRAKMRYCERFCMINMQDRMRSIYHSFMFMILIPAGES